MGYDIIGDVHGQSEKLIALLRRLGYRHHLGAWRHPQHTAIFVGDFIDRGSGQLATLDVVRPMIDAGTALAVMGNHEFNAIAWYMPDPDADGHHLRQRTHNHRNQHAAFLVETEHRPALHEELVRWFLTLPVWLELPELRVIHACWDPLAMAALQPTLADGLLLTPRHVEAASRPNTGAYHCIERLLKGIEVELPFAFSFDDKGGYHRKHARVRWWDASLVTYRQAAILPGGGESMLPDREIPEAARLGYDSDKPVFFGHYWMTGIARPLMPNVACVDYSAGNDGPLMAYRWDGEPALTAANFVSSDQPLFNLATNNAQREGGQSGRGNPISPQSR